MLRLPYLQGSSPWYPLNRKLGRSQSRSGRFGGEKNLISLNYALFFKLLYVLVEINDTENAYVNSSCGYVACIKLSQYRVQCQGLVTMVMNVMVPQKVR